MNKNPLISIIVPVYNGQRYLCECIDSILKQDYQNIEVIIVNDGSKDDSGKIIDEYAKRDKRVKAIHQENGGVSVARNTALDIVQGKYICLIDQDDCVCEDYISYFYNLIIENDADISLTPTANRFNGNIDTSAIKNFEDSVEIWSGEKTVEKMLYYQLIISPWNKMISRSLIEENNLKFDSRFFSGEGFLFSIECFQRAKRVAVGQKKVYLYRVDNPDSGMTKFSLHVINSSVGAQKVIKENLLNPTERLMKACRYSNWHTHCDCLNTIIGCNVKKQHKDLYKKIRKVCKNDALCVIGAPVSKKEKMKGFLYFISPYFAAKIINRFRLRKFTVEQ